MLYISTQPTPEVILFEAKFAENFQGVIMLVILIKIGLHLLKIALIVLFKYWYRDVLIILIL